MIVRTATGTSECTPMLRTTSGLVECGDAMIRTVTGLVSIGSLKPLTAEATPGDVYGATDQPGSVNVSSNPTTVRVTGGRAPFSYLWSRVDGDIISANSPASATTSFSGNVPRNDVRNATFTCTVTDAVGHTATSNAVFATLANYGDAGGIL